MGQLPRAERSDSVKILVLFDHDGTICETNNNAYESIKYGVREAAKLCKIDITLIENNWDSFFHETRGTTEMYVANYVFLRALGGTEKALDEFRRIYYQARSNWYHNMKTYQEYTYDTYYPDAENLIFQCWKDSNVHIGLLTGNPEWTMKERLAKHLQELFFSDGCINTFGNESASRQGLIQLAIEKAQTSIPDFKLIKNSHGIIQNVIYIGDSRADLFAGILARVKTLWIPSRMLQTVKDAKSEDAICVLSDFLPGSILITNNLELPESLNFVFS